MQARPKSKPIAENPKYNELNELVTRYILAGKPDEGLEKIRNLVIDSVRTESESKRLKHSWKSLDADGNTALHLAVLAQNFQMIKILLRLHLAPDPNCVNRLNKTPARLAAEQDELFIEQYISSNEKERQELSFKAADEGLKVNVQQTTGGSIKPIKRSELVETLNNSYLNRVQGKKIALETLEESPAAKRLGYWPALREVEDRYKDLPAHGEETARKVEAVYFDANRDGARILNQELNVKEKAKKKNARHALVGNVDAIKALITKYDKNKDYGRAMLFSCFAAVYSQDGGAHKEYIENFKSHDLSSFTFNKEKKQSLYDLKTFLQECLQDNKLSALQRKHAELDPLSLILLAMEFLKQDKNAVAIKAEAKLTSTIKSVLADAMGVDKKKGAAEIAKELGHREALVKKIIGDHQLEEKREVTFHTKVEMPAVRLSAASCTTFAAPKPIEHVLAKNPNEYTLDKDPLDEIEGLEAGPAKNKRG